MLLLNAPVVADVAAALAAFDCLAAVEADVLVDDDEGGVEEAAVPPAAGVVVLLSAALLSLL